jgi:hypothetical protein
MQMIDVLKRLAELDATNSNIIKESFEVAECGPMGMMGAMSEPKTPATLNITANSGEELGNMLNAIMQLAGVHKVEPEHLGVEHEPVVLTPEPSAAVGPSASDSEIMRGVIDKMNPDVGAEHPASAEKDGEEIEDEGYDNTPADPREPLAFDSEEHAAHPNDGSGDDKKGRPRTMAQPAAMEDRLMAEYLNFINESTK